MAKRLPHLDYTDRSHYTDGPQTPQTVVLHTWEADGKGVEGLKTVKRILDSQELSANFATTKDGKTAMFASPTIKCRATLKANTGRVHIEQAGYANFTKAQWLARPRQLHAAAKIIASMNKLYGIPIRSSVTHGVCQHKDIPGQDHTDCGPGYPIGFVKGLARVYRRTLFI